MKRYIKSDSDIPASAFDANSNTRYQIAQATESPDLLEIYTYDPDSDVRWAVAENLHTPVECLRILSEDPDAWPRIGVAKNPNTPHDILLKFAHSDDIWPMSKVAENPAAPSDVLLELARGENFRGFGDAVTTLARHPNLSPEAMKILLDDRDNATYYVKVELIDNPNVTKEILERLAKDTDFYIRRAAEHELEYRGWA